MTNYKTGMDEARAIMQQAIEKKRTAQQIAPTQVTSTKPAIFDQVIIDALLSDDGYQGYRIQRDASLDNDYVVQEYRKKWGWTLLDSFGFRSYGSCKSYKTLAPALRRAKKEMDGPFA